MACTGRATAYLRTCRTWLCLDERSVRRSGSVSSIARSSPGQQERTAVFCDKTFLKALKKYNGVLTCIL